MKNLIYIIVVCFYCLSFTLSAQEKYRNHTVKEGETAYSIAKQYKITINEIYRLNPDVKNGIKADTILILPLVDGFDSNDPNVKFKKHRVRRKETLFSISQKYKVSIDDIKRYNKHLYSKALKKGEKLMIPISLKKSTTVNSNNTTIVTNTFETKKHSVQPKETKYGIARKYGITIAELEMLNPNIGEMLQIGTVLNVPKLSVINSAIIEEDNFEFYEVQPKEGFYRLKVKLGLTKEVIITLNPYAKEGLKEGMILIIPKKNNEIISYNLSVINLENSISNYKKKNIVLMLPFRLQRVDTDSIKANIELLKKDKNLCVALDFYSGVLMAAEFIKDKGISVNIDVYDTEANESKVGRIISNNNFKNVDAVIGPLLQKNVVKAISMLRSTDTPVFSPLSNREIKSYSNFFQTIPSIAMLERAMLDYIKNNRSGKNLILICDNKRNKQKEAILSYLHIESVLNPRTGEKGIFLYKDDIESKLTETIENWVILESANPVLVSNVVGLLNGMPEEYNIRLFTLDKNKVYDYHDISNLHLANLNFTFPSVKKNYNPKVPNPFITSYKNKYGVLPNRYAIRGFDVTYDVLLRLASADDVYDTIIDDFETEYIENKFRYTKKLFSGYQNNALYIIKYDKDLQVGVVK